MKHKFWARGMSIGLLILVGSTASIGGFYLMRDPSGVSMGYQQVEMSIPIFNDFLIPGIVLFVVFGILSLVSAFLALKKFVYFPTLVLHQGLLLVGWISVQWLILPQTHFLQAIYFLLGVMLMLLGSIQRSSRVL